MNPAFECEYEAGVILQKVASDRLDIAWFKAMVTATDLERVTGCQKAKEAAFTLKTAMTLLNQARHMVLDLAPLEAARLTNLKGGRKELPEMLAEFRAPIKTSDFKWFEAERRADMRQDAETDMQLNGEAAS